MSFTTSVDDSQLNPVVLVVQVEKTDWLRGYPHDDHTWSVVTTSATTANERFKFDAYGNWVPFTQGHKLGRHQPRLHW